MARGEGSKWDVGNIMNDEPIHANSITPAHPTLDRCSPIIEGGKLTEAGFYSTEFQSSTFHSHLVDVVLTYFFG